MLLVFRLIIFITLSIAAFKAHTKILLDADNIDSISHFRAFTPLTDDSKKSPLIRHTIEDSRGYIWMAGDPSLTRYDGYEFKPYLREGFGRLGACGITFTHLSSDGTLWAGDCALHKYDPIKDEFKGFNITKKDEIINFIVDYKDDQLLVAGDKFGLLAFDKKTQQVVNDSRLNQTIGNDIDIVSIVYDKDLDQAWIASTQGIFTFRGAYNNLEKIYDLSPHSYGKYELRDMSYHKEKHLLWVATANGLLKINTNTHKVTIYGKGDNKKGLITQQTTTTYLDSNKNLWVGTEKQGLCLYKPTADRFICIESSIEREHAISVATIEDISEDNEGSLWISVNQFGVLRITPDIEKIITLRDTFSNDIKEYFPYTFNAIVRENGDVWLGTDGGGINIFNYKDKSIKNIRHDPDNENSLPSDSIISLTEDADGFIWAGFWAGGISKINPDEMTFTNFQSNCKNSQSCLGGNNIFVVEADSRGGIWLSIWGYGLQYYDIKNNIFSPIIDDKNSNKRSHNKNVVSVSEKDNKLWIAGGSGLEYYDYQTHTFVEVLSDAEEYSLTSLLTDDDDIFYIGSRLGLIKYNYKTEEITKLTTHHGLADNVIFYLKKDSEGNIWIATANGISIFNPKTGTFRSLFKKDGLVSNEMSTYGEFFEIDGKIYSTSKKGVNIIDPKNLPKSLNIPKTILSSVKPIINEDDKSNIPYNQFRHIINPRIPHTFNNLQFDFTALSFVFPEKNRFKYRLLGWKDTYTEVDSHKRTARFTNLSSGKYTFEVFASNSSGLWDRHGVQYSFSISPPWYQQWWVIFLFMILFASIIYFSVQFKIAIRLKQEKELSSKIEKELSEKVEEKTSQLQEQAVELKKTSDSLSMLNAELESRVDQRTAELQVEINERRLAESKLFHMAFHDSLTGLPNREWLIQKMEKTISQSLKDHSFKYCLMFLDGDRFKQINDTHGHIVGDQLLISAANRLSRLMTDNQYVTRLGGDEFTVFAQNINNEQEMINLAGKIIEAFTPSFCIENNNIYFHVSIGLVICDYNYQLVTSILRDADIAMYKAKEQGKGTYKLFDTEMRTITLSLAELESDLHNAIANNEFFLMYQPVIDLKTNCIIGFEALIRWKHPVNGMVSPLDFIPLAEETGLIWDIGAWVIDESLRQMQQWHSLDCAIKPTIAVNISSGQLRNAIFLELLDSKIKKYKINPSFLKLELTESVLMENNETVSHLIDELNHRNIDLAIDDFGTGYSSLAYLNEIPVQQIKIDKRFIDAIDATASGEINQDALAIVKATISLGKSLRKQVTAEGIESQLQLDALREFGCNFAQGYFIAKPLTNDDAYKVLMVNKEYDMTSLDRKLNRENLLDRYKAALKNRTNRLRDRHT